MSVELVVIDIINLDVKEDNKKNQSSDYIHRIKPIWHISIYNNLIS